jgi:hypothetical protein
MPYAVRRKGNRYEVVNTDTGKSHGLTTKAKAERQKRLLEGIEHGGWRPSSDGKYTRTVQGRKQHLTIVGGQGRAAK